MSLSASTEQANSAELEEGLARLRPAAFLLAVDHGRAGGNFFTRLFDQHPEVLTLPYVSYLYEGLLRLAGERVAIPGKEAFEHVTASSNVSLLFNDLTPKTRALFVRMGNDPEAPIDRSVMRRVLQALVRDRDLVTPPEVVRAVYLGYALATGRSLRCVRYLLITDSVSSRDSRLLEAGPKESTQLRVIHLVRDPRANFASLRHQYVNQWRSMYPLDRLLRGETVCVWLWILRTSTQGAKAIRTWKSRLDPRQFLTVRNEDLNLRFVPTLERITRWLGVGWYTPWSSPDYVPTSNGRPWQGISAFSTAYQPFTEGPLPNDPPGRDRFRSPNREVTERWQKRLLSHEVAFLEAIHERELRELGYPFLFLGSRQSKFRALLNVLRPFAGELPPLRWYTRFTSWRDLLRKASYPLLLPIAYVASRLWFASLYLRGELR